MMNQDWFEMKDIRRKNFSKSVWIPLRAIETKVDEGEYGYVGYKKEFFGSGSIAIPQNKIEDAKKLGWMDIGISNEHSGWIDEDKYIPAEVYKGYGNDLEGVHLVLDQNTYGETPNIWHLNQDLVLSLSLVREGNSWVCPKEGYTEVARLRTSDEDAPVALEIKSQYLKDYLCARGMALYMTHYFERDVVCDGASHISWPDGSSSETAELDQWEGRVIEIHEGGEPIGAKMAVFHMSRTDVDESDDVPDISGPPTEENTYSESWERGFEGRSLFRVVGELWRNEIILPSASSPRVRGDSIIPTTFFVIDAEGNKICGQDLIDAGKWLWFKPEVIMALSHVRGGNLSFFTAQTGRVSCSYGYGVHFGVNDLAYVNVYAKDIGRLPEWQQQIWAGYNLVPEGGVSSELLASQVKAIPADTKAPEEFLPKVFELINSLAQEKMKIQLFRKHELIPELLPRIHRFRSIDEQSFYALAKVLARLTADSLDAQAMQTIVTPPKKVNWGSLKSLENLLASEYDRDLVRKITAPLVGVYELRHADAHLPSSKIEEAFSLIQIDRSSPYVQQGFQLLHQVVSSLFGVLELLQQADWMKHK
ncbi:hypothetical protein [Desulfovibrio sp. JC010]|uniref:hypothetical protein n=1 Tax=Desulfovibrio sp. JC010 TaxID=2593641 RepID=UPI0013D0B009|nr:hypothetical protein [Desulfovibrio sp. JC010]NDV28680.1 hypothetical protein [Desulfovibrio sp. JC010]